MYLANAHGFPTSNQANWMENSSKCASLKGYINQNHILWLTHEVVNDLLNVWHPFSHECSCRQWKSHVGSHQALRFVTAASHLFFHLKSYIGDILNTKIFIAEIETFILSNMESTNLDLLNFGITGLCINYHSSQYIFLFSLIHQGQIKLIKSDSIRHL